MATQRPCLKKALLLLSLFIQINFTIGQTQFASSIQPRSEVSFTSFKHVSPGEWEEFYRDRGVGSKPNVPGPIRTGIIPVVHYSYKIQHPRTRVETPVEKPSPQENYITERTMSPNVVDKYPSIDIRNYFPKRRGSDQIIFPNDDFHQNFDRREKVGRRPNYNAIGAIDRTISRKPFRPYFGKVQFTTNSPIRHNTINGNGNIFSTPNKYRDDSALLEEFEEFLVKNPPSINEILGAMFTLEDE